MKGLFKPRNPQKYKGDPTNIVYRSSWEWKYMQLLDASDDILEWSSEMIRIPYRSPLDQKVHGYFPDFHIKTKTSDGKIENTIIEIKPLYETQPCMISLQNKKLKRRRTKQIITYEINQRKWASARAFCEDRGWKFQILTEYDLGIKSKYLNNLTD